MVLTPILQSRSIMRESDSSEMLHGRARLRVMAGMGGGVTICDTVMLRSCTHHVILYLNRFSNRRMTMVVS